MGAFAPRDRTMTIKRTVVVVMCVSLAAVGAGSASAGPLTWNLTSSSACSSSGSGDGNTRTCSGSAGAPSVTASAWSNTGGPSDTLIENALLQVFSGGLGVRNRDRSKGDTGELSSPQHAVDNINRYDAVLFSFASAVALTELGIGYKSGDSDVTVMAYLGGGAPPLAGATYASLLGLGWSLVGHYSNLSTSSAALINASSLSSMYWLIGAFNPTVGSNPGWSIGNDAIKLSLLGGEIQTVPEPVTLTLVGLGLGGLVVARRRHKARRQI